MSAARKIKPLKQSTHDVKVSMMSFNHVEDLKMARMSAKDKAEFRKTMAEKGYSRIAVYAPTNAKKLREEILEVTNKMVEDYEKLNKE